MQLSKPRSQFWQPEWQSDTQGELKTILWCNTSPKQRQSENSVKQKHQQESVKIRSAPINPVFAQVSHSLERHPIIGRKVIAVKWKKWRHQLINLRKLSDKLWRKLTFIIVLISVELTTLRRLLHRHYCCCGPWIGKIECRLDVSSSQGRGYDSFL